MSPEVRLELQRLLSALCDGQLTEAQHQRLEELLVADADCRRLYLEYIDMHARLLVHPRLSGGEGHPDASPGNPIPNAETAPPTPEALAPGRRRPRVPQLLRYAGVAAATLAASLL